MQMKKIEFEDMQTKKETGFDVKERKNQGRRNVVLRNKRERLLNERNG